MKLSDHDLRQLDEKVIRSLSPDAVENLAVNLLDDLKDSRERLNQNSQNSSGRPVVRLPGINPLLIPTKMMSKTMTKAVGL